MGLLLIIRFQHFSDFIAAGRCRARQRLICYVVSVISMTLNIQRGFEVTQQAFSAIRKSKHAYLSDASHSRNNTQGVKS